MLILGVVLLVGSIVVERVITFRSVQLVGRAGGDLTSHRLEDERYHDEGGPPRWMSGIALLCYFLMLVGLLLIIVALVRVVHRQAAGAGSKRGQIVVSGNREAAT